MNLPIPEHRLSDAYRIDRLTAEFLFPETEWAFRRSIREVWVRQTRTAMVIAALFYLMFVFTDWVVMRGSPAYYLVMLNRFSVSLIGLSVAYFARPLWRQMVNGAAPTLVVGFGMIGFVWKAMLVPLEFGIHGMGMMAMLLGVYVFVPNRFLNALVVSLVASAGFLLVAMFHFNLEVGQILTLIALLVVTNILGAMVTWRTSMSMRIAFCNQTVLMAANERLEREAEERLRLETELRHRADHDETTGVANRAAFFEAAGLLFAESEAKGQPLSLLLVDVDYFKQLNGTYGHLRGDDVLRALVAVCREVLRRPHYLARFGGEEFVVMLPEATLAEAAKVAEQLRTECQRTPVAIAEVAIHFTISAGVAQRHPSEPLNALLRRADEAVFAAKYKGRNRVEAVA